MAGNWRIERIPSTAVGRRLLGVTLREERWDTHLKRGARQWVLVLGVWFTGIGFWITKGDN